MTTPPSEPRITPERVVKLLRLLERLLPFVPERYRSVASVLLTVGIAGFGIIYGTEVEATYREDRPALASALTHGGDYNLVLHGDGRVDSSPVVLDRKLHDYDGHGKLSRWEARAPGGVRLPAAPVMTWEFPPLRGTDDLRFCFSEADAAGAWVGQQARLAVRQTWDVLATTSAPRYVESCANPHAMYGVTAQQDCRMQNALGCALYLRYGQHMRITGDATRLDARGVYSAFLHEVGHFLNLDHTGCDHGHHTNMSGLFAPSGPPCGANGEYRVSREDLADAIRYYGWRTLEVSPTAQPTSVPTATVIPTAIPTPTPPPRSQQPLELWLYRPDGAACDQIGGEGEWIVVNCWAPRGWYHFGNGNFIQFAP